MLGKAAKEAQAYLSIGVPERDAVNGTLYNSNIIFKPDGAIDVIHRKLKSADAEHLIWGDADKDYFPIMESPWGPISNLISYAEVEAVSLLHTDIPCMIGLVITQETMS